MDHAHRLRGRVAIVTGAAGGFGTAIGERLHAEGARVALWDFDETGAMALAERLDPSGETTLGLGVDVRESAAVDAAVATSRAALGPIDILVNNAGISGAMAPWDVTDESWHEYFRVNADGTFFCIRACLPDMRERRSGKIVNIGSLAAQSGRPTTHPAYPASKGAVLGLTVSLARNLGEYGICVNAINPGWIRTPIMDQFTPEELEPLMAGIPLSRNGQPGVHGLPEDIAAAVAYLASSDGDYVSGEFLSVNGATRTGS